MFQWALAAALICGASVFTACTSDTSDNPTEQAKKNRKEFIAHTRQNLKTVAENLNFSSWTGINHLNNDFNTNVLNNPAFDLTTTLKVSDCAKVIQLQNQMASARRNYADQQTIEQYTQQLNQLVSGTMTCQGLGRPSR